MTPVLDFVRAEGVVGADDQITVDGVDLNHRASDWLCLRAGYTNSFTTPPSRVFTSQIPGLCSFWEDYVNGKQTIWTCEPSTQEVRVRSIFPLHIGEDTARLQIGYTPHLGPVL